MISNNKQLNKVKGYIAEELVADYLKAKGYEIVEQNFECKIGEIDIVAWDNDCLVIVEVRSKSNDVYGSGLDSINSAKQRQIAKTATVYIKANNLYDTSVRFDCVEVIEDQINHIEDAFYTKIRL